MINTTSTLRTLAAASTLLLLASCATTQDAATDPAGTTSARAPIAASFEAQGQAGLDRLEQDEMQASCSEYEGKPLPEGLAEKITRAATDGVRYPTDGNFLGDWRAGNLIAQTGTGLQSNDDPKVANGGNCYACHQLAPEEIAFGNLGPPLVQYGKLRGASEPMLKYTWARLWNSHAFNACSHMPRFGDAGILTEQQLRDVMAFLFDPASPVNQAVVAAP